MAGFLQGILSNVMGPSSQSGGSGPNASSGANAAASASASGAAAAGFLTDRQSAEAASAAAAASAANAEEISALPDQCQLVEDTIEPLRLAFEKVGKRADKCSQARKQAEETALRDAFLQSTDAMRTKSNLFECVLEGLAGMEQTLIDQRAGMYEAMGKWAGELRDREHRLAGLQQERRNLCKLSADLSKLRRRLGHAVVKQQVAAEKAGGGSAAAASAEAVGELQLEVSSKENEERKERDAYIVRLNTLQGEKPAHCHQLLQLMQDRLRYHSECARQLQLKLPELQAEVDRITRLSGPCYGVPLGEHLARTDRRIAYVIDVCTSALKRDDVMDEEGLFRVNGPSSSVHKLESFLDVMQADSEIGRYDSASVCGALKKYLKQLPEPLVGQSLLPDWKKACAFVSSDERRMALHSCCCELQRRLPQHYENLRHLVKFLALVCERQERNKMSPKNLGICIGPNIVGSLSATAAATLPSLAIATPANGGVSTSTIMTTAAPPNYDDLHSANLGTLIVENLIIHHVFCFGSDDLRSPPSDLPSHRFRSLSSANANIGS